MVLLTTWCCGIARAGPGVGASLVKQAFPFPLGGASENEIKSNDGLASRGPIWWEAYLCRSFLNRDLRGCFAGVRECKNAFAHSLYSVR
jgi:hypothetical protein